MSAPARRLADYLDLIARWAWVMVPLSWGVWQTVRTSMALFR